MPSTVLFCQSPTLLSPRLPRSQSELGRNLSPSPVNLPAPHQYRLRLRAPLLGSVAKAPCPSDSVRRQPRNREGSETKIPHDVIDHFHALCADVTVAQTTYVSCTHSLPSTWPQVLQVLASASIIGSSLTRICSSLDLFSVLSLPPSTFLNLFSFLRDQLNFSYVQRTRLLKRNPDLLYLKPDDVHSLLLALYTDAGFTKREVRKMILRWPQLLLVRALVVKRVVKYLSRPPVTFSRDQLTPLLRRAPWLFTIDFDKRLAPSVYWLDQFFNADQISFIILVNPRILATQRAKLSAVRNFLLKFVKLSNKQTIDVIFSFPHILTCEIGDISILKGFEIDSPHDSSSPLSPVGMAVVLLELTREIGLTKRNIANIVHAFPAILTLDVNTNIRPVVSYLQNVAGIQNISRVVKRLPPILGYDVETNIHPKMEYLLKEVKLSLMQILLFPAVFSYPLQDRIKPRTRFLMVRQIRVSEVGLNRAVSMSDEEFCKQVAKVPVKTYATFVDYLNHSYGVSKRLKFAKKGIKKHAPTTSDVRKQKQEKSNTGVAHAEKESDKYNKEGTVEYEEDSQGHSQEEESGLKKPAENRVWGKGRFRSTLSRISWSELG